MSELFLRNVLEAAMVLPAAGYALLPVRDDLRYPKKQVFGIVLLVTGAYIIIQALVNTAKATNADYLTIPALIILYIAYHLAVDLSFGKKLYCFLNACMLSAFCVMYTGFLRAPVEQFDPNGPFQISSSLICLGIALAIGLAYFQILTQKLPDLLREDRLNPIWPVLACIQGLMTLLMYWASPSDHSVIMAGRIRPIALLMLLLIPAVTLLLNYLFWWVTIQMAKSARLQQENDLLYMEQKRYTELQSYVNATRTLRHDFRQHLRVLGELSQHGETEKLVDYLGQLTDSADLDYTRFCANSSVDAIASWYDNQAKEQGVKLQWDLNLPENLPVGEADFCGILGNLLENALRASAKEVPGNRKIRVISHLLSDKMVGLSVENAYSGKVRFDKNGLPMTSRLGRGTGMSSVAATVHHYKGSLDISCEEGIFSVNILLYAQ